ncbi:MAG: Ig-like domain-containing protein, partial [Nanoarchaeota archaeon]|nr:Ig-like domain-containing protein [Nanoarchaeota archaeon]
LSDLDGNHAYTVAVDRTVKDAVGNSMLSPYSWSFATAAHDDTTPPTVTSITPVSGATGVSEDTDITVTFSEGIDDSPLTLASVQLSSAYKGWFSGSISYNSNNNIITRSNDYPIAGGTAYTVLVDKGDIADLSGNDLANDYTWSFTTAGVPFVRESVGSVNLPQTAIAVDSNNKVHMCYKGLSDQDLKYVTNASGSWVTETISSNAYNNASTPSIAVDSNGYAHVCYLDTARALKYATNSSGAWVTEGGTFPDLSPVSYLSIAVDSSGKVHIACAGDESNSSRSLKYIRNASGNWSTATIDSVYVYGTSIALDSNDEVHISYGDTTNHAVKYTTENVGRTWPKEIVDDLNNLIPIGVSMSLDSNDKAHISYGVSSPNSRKYATNMSGGWITEALPQGFADTSGNKANASLGVDSNNKVHISYCYQNSLKYMNNTSGSWVYQTVDPGGEESTGNGYYNSLVIDSNNKIHISYGEKIGVDEVMHAVSQ